MGWLRLVGSLKSQVSFAEYRLFYRALLQKRPIILRSLLAEATPYDTFQRKIYTPDMQEQEKLRWKILVSEKDSLESVLVEIVDQGSGIV